MPEDCKLDVAREPPVVGTDAENGVTHPLIAHCFPNRLYGVTDRPAGGRRGFRRDELEGRVGGRGAENMARRLPIGEGKFQLIAGDNLHRRLVFGWEAKVRQPTTTLGLLPGYSHAVVRECLLDAPGLLRLDGQQRQECLSVVGAGTIAETDCVGSGGAEVGELLEIGKGQVALRLAAPCLFEPDGRGVRDRTSGFDGAGCGRGTDPGNESALLDNWSPAARIVLVLGEEWKAGPTEEKDLRSVCVGNKAKREGIFPGALEALDGGRADRAVVGKRNRLVARLDEVGDEMRTGRTVRAVAEPTGTLAAVNKALMVGNAAVGTRYCINAGRILSPRAGFGRQHANCSVEVLKLPVVELYHPVQTLEHCH
jgi:hypothetical protein